MNLFLGTACLVFEQTFSAEKWQIPTPHHRATRAFDYWQMLVSAPTGPAVSPLGQLITEKDNYLAYGRASRRERTVFFFTALSKYTWAQRSTLRRPPSEFCWRYYEICDESSVAGLSFAHTHTKKRSQYGVIELRLVDLKSGRRRVVLSAQRRRAITPIAICGKLVRFRRRDGSMALYVERHLGRRRCTAADTSLWVSFWSYCLGISPFLIISFNKRYRHLVQ